MGDLLSIAAGGRGPITFRLAGDDALARMAARGDARAFAAIYERHHQELYRYCRSLCGDADDASDALQSTMTAALRALPGETRKISLRPWLFRIAHNESVSLIRKRRPHAGLAEAPPVEAPGPDGQASVRERLGRLLADLRELPERQRGALLMREMSGLDYEEIGAALGVSAPGARQAVYEARAALHELADGRDMGCSLARRRMSAKDGRMLRGRKLRAHLRACHDCRDFSEQLSLRRAALRSLAPPLPAASAAAILAGLVGGGGTGSGAGAGGGGVVSLVAASFSQAAGASSAAKGAAAAAVAVVAGVGGIEVASDPTGRRADDGEQVVATAPRDRDHGPSSGALPAERRAAPPRELPRRGAPHRFRVPAPRPPRPPRGSPGDRPAHPPAEGPPADPSTPPPSPQPVEPPAAPVAPQPQRAVPDWQQRYASTLEQAAQAMELGRQSYAQAMSTTREILSRILPGSPR